MDNNVVSFRIDHFKLIPGIYLHEIKDYGTNYVTTYDFRFKKPNTGDVLTPCQSHTIEHVMATFFTSRLKDKVYWGPMGCLTGFYLVLNGKHTFEDVLETLEECDAYWKELVSDQKVPAKNPQKCGNYRLLDINEGYKAWNEFYSNKENWGKAYPVIDGDYSDENAYQNDISYDVRLK